MRGEKIEVLDRGYVEVIDFMGDDKAIVDAARVSYAEGTSFVRSDEKLLRYLMRKKHTSPFEQCEIKLRIKVPLFVWQQWLRHRTASINQESHRYSEVKHEFYQPGPGGWRAQGHINKQGSGETLIEGDELHNSYGRMNQAALQTYEDFLDKGVAREQARMVVLPGTYTTAIWKIDLHNLLHFLQLRLDPHAQQEIREYAEAIADLVREWVPVTWEAFEDYRLNALTFSLQEQDILGVILTTGGIHESVIDSYPDMGRSEKEEFKKKLARLLAHAFSSRKSEVSDEPESSEPE